MPNKAVTISLPDWLFEAATTAATKRNQSLEAMLWNAAFNYAERYAPEALASEQIPSEEIPPIIRLANAIISTAIDKTASEIHLLPPAGKSGSLSVVVRAGDEMSEMMTVPSHIHVPLYDRYVVMTSTLLGIRKSNIPVSYNGKTYQVFVSWEGSYQDEMVLRIVSVS